MPETSSENLVRRLAEQGPMSVGEYMRWCLTGREDAYYRDGNPLGGAGDFVTAPEVSQIFGELISMWACAVWQSAGAPSPFTLAELGPGRGTLMQDAIRASRSVPEFHEAARVHLVETSATLRETQRQTLIHACTPEWHEDISALPAVATLAIANEFFDALPVEQYVFSQGEWRRRVVALNDQGELAFAVGGFAPPPMHLLPKAPPCEGDILEHHPDVIPIMNELGRRAKTAPLALVLADYGYERLDYGDTFQAVRHHGYASVFETPGEIDLSAHVSFTELRMAAEAAGLQVFGPMPQGDFLLALGLEQRLRQLLANADLSEEQRATLFLGARRLADPFQMGSLFKVMAITSADVPPPPPFANSVASKG
ncbi:MAG: SAM-dependent methyltransferase [Alphaproteobacteria bacterium]